MTWLVTGGAGYIGAHVIRELFSANEEIVVLDDLSTGISANVPKNIEFIEGSIIDANIIKATLEKYSISGIINLAALKSVAESELYPERYESINHVGVRTLIEESKKFGVKYFIQSSTAAVYGNSKSGFVSEGDKTIPISQYGLTKSKAEDALNEAIDSNSLVGVSLRYFNVLGSATPELKDRSTANIVPMVLESLSMNKAPRIFGDDYTTYDGTCIRDYVHVEDIARAHALAVMKLRTSNLPKAINIGTGTGYSVREIMTEILKQSRSTLEPVVVDRRQGDPAILVAKVSLAKGVLGFEAKKTLEEMISTSI
jgi:UDP-glucose 4-epimerase